MHNHVCAQIQNRRVSFDIQRDRKQSILKRVLAEDIAESRRYDRAEPVIHQGPDGVFARTATTEVVTGDENPAALRLRLIQDKVGITAPIRKQMGADSVLARDLQKTCRNDLIG